MVVGSDPFVVKMELQDGLPWNTLFRRKPVSTK